EVLQLLAAVPLALLFLLLVRDHSSDRSARAILFFVSASLAHSFLALVPAASATGTFLYLLGSLVAGSFWLLAKVHFDDDFRLQARHVALLAGALLAAALASPAAAPVSPLIRLLPKVLGLAFAVHALLTIYVGARSDLMVSRLRLRYVVLWS